MRDRKTILKEIKSLQSKKRELLKELKELKYKEEIQTFTVKLLGVTMKRIRKKKHVLCESKILRYGLRTDFKTIFEEKYEENLTWENYVKYQQGEWTLEPNGKFWVCSKLAKYIAFKDDFSIKLCKVHLTALTRHLERSQRKGMG